MKVLFYEDAVLDIDNIVGYYKSMSSTEKLDKKFLNLLISLRTLFFFESFSRELFTNNIHSIMVLFDRNANKLDHCRVATVGVAKRY